MFSYTLTPSSMNLFIYGKPSTIDSTHVNYALIREAVRQYGHEQRAYPKAVLLDKIKGWLDIKSLISKFTEGAVQVSEDAVLFHGQPVKGALADRLVSLVAEGFSPAPLARFLLKLQSNPTPTARDELYLWLETSNLPICDDGDFLAYKAVRDDYKSHHDGETDNSVGATLKMPREDVDPERDNTCSRGYHFCSLNYLSVYGSGRIVVCKIDPSEVVTIPSDYSNQKGRAWRYKIVDEVARASLPTYLNGVHIAQATDDGIVDGSETVVMESVDQTIDEQVAGEDFSAEYVMNDADISFVNDALINDVISEHCCENIAKVLAGDCGFISGMFVWDDTPQGYEFWRGQALKKELTVEGRAILEAYMRHVGKLPPLEKAVEPENDPANWVWVNITEEYLPGGSLASDISLDPVETVKSNKYEATLSNGSSTVSLSELKALLKEHGQRGTARLTGIPRTTLQDWITKYSL